MTFYKNVMAPYSVCESTIKNNNKRPHSLSALSHLVNTGYAGQRADGRRLPASALVHLAPQN